MVHKINNEILCIIHPIFPNSSQHEIALRLKQFSVIICSGSRGDVSGIVCQYDIWDGAQNDRRPAEGSRQTILL